MTIEHITKLRSDLHDIHVTYERFADGGGILRIDRGTGGMLNSMRIDSADINQDLGRLSLALDEIVREINREVDLDD